MNKKTIIGATVVGVALLIGLGGYVAVKMARPKPQPQTVAVEATATPAKAVAPATVQLTFDQVDALAQRLVPIMEQKLINLHKELDGEHGVFKDDRTTTCKLEEVDLKHTSSLVHPVVGEIVWTQYDTIKQKDFSHFTLDRYTLHLSQRNGEWSFVSLESRCERHNTFPEPPVDRTGKVTTYTAEWIAKELAAATKAVRNAATR